MKLETFFEKFDQFADAPDAVAKMREMVLHLAITGKLVPQDPNDEPAEDSFPKLASLALESYDDDFPTHWLRVPLGKMGEWRGGGTPSKSRPEFWEGDLPWVSPKDMKVLHIADAQDHISPAAVEGSSVRLIPYGSLLMVVRGMILARAFPVALTMREVTINQDMKALLPSVPKTKEYLLVALRAFEPDVLAAIEHSSHGTCKLKTEFLQDFVIPLPPLAEQKRIVAKVDELMALCDRLEAQQQERKTRHAALVRASLARFADAPTPANLPFLFHPSYAIPPADLRKSILTLAVQGKLVPQDPNDEPAEVLLHRLRSEKLEKINRGTMRKLRSNEDSFVADTETSLPPGWASGCVADFGAPEDNAIVDGPFGSNLKLSDYDPQGVYPVITISNIDEGFDLPTLRKVTEKKFQELKRSAVRANDILVAKIGSSYGKVGLYPDYMPVGIIPANLLKITPHPSMDWRFLVIALRSPDFKAELEPIVQFTAQPAFGVSKFKLLPISVPPLAEQRRIVAKVEQLMALVDELETQLAASRATAANLLSALVAELTGTPNNAKVSTPKVSTTGRRGRPPKS